ncbi:hypothetical protein, partial [Caballeronia arationis]|uniref:hypothetical protein n=1 Tax=Caballeronia arationis TaxID=1777142 RepID=UPI001F19C0F3
MVSSHSRIRKLSTLTDPTAPIPPACPDAARRQIRLLGKTRNHLVKKTAKGAPVSPAKRIVGKKTAKPAVKKVAKSMVASRKAV